MEQTEQMEQNVIPKIAVPSYQTFKHTLDTELRKTAEGFVKIGYLLKVARDTEVLKESGYTTVTEFAAAEYGLTKDVVSRYIAINDRYSENGYSERLQSKYSEYGVAKLAEMLTLPDEVVAQMSPKLTRTEIQEIKKEITEEKQITDIEVLLEPRTDYQNIQDLLEKAMYQYCHDERITYLALTKAAGQEGEREIIEGVLDVLAPSGFDVKMIRIPGTGKLMLSLGAENGIEVLNVRTSERAKYEWRQLIAFLKTFCPEPAKAKKNWESIYGELFEEKIEEAPKQEPVKPPLAAVTPAGGTVHEVGKGKVITDSIGSMTHTPENDTKNPEINTENTIVAPVQPEEQLPGQKNIKDYSEYLPDSQKPKEVITTEKGQEVIIDPDSRETETREVTVHELKCYPEFFEAAAAGKKNFTLRFNDRNYQSGDILKKKEVDENGNYTGRYLEQQIIYILEDYTGLKQGYCILGTELLTDIMNE